MQGESIEKQPQFRRYPMFYKIQEHVTKIWNFPVIQLKFNYFHICPIVIVFCFTCNYIYLVTSYRRTIAKVLDLDIWTQTAFVFITTFFIGNMVGNGILKWESFYTEIRSRSSEKEKRNTVEDASVKGLTTEEESNTVEELKALEQSKGVDVAKTAMERKIFEESALNPIQILMAFASSCHKRYSLLNLCHIIMLCTFLSFCTYQYLKHKVQGFSVVNEHLRYLFANHYFYESFVDHPEWPLQEILPLLTFIMMILITAVVMLCKRVITIIGENSIRWRPKDCVEFLFGTKWYLAMIWPFVKSPEPQNVHVKSS